jgi:GAF domain-containing protein
MSTFLSMPLRGHGGRVVGLMALSSATKNAFGETALATLRLVEGPAAIVVDNARLAGARTP